MDAHALEVLDFPKLLAMLSAGAESPQGKALCRGTRPLSAPAAAEAALGELSALAALEAQLGLPSVSGLRSIDGHLDATRAEGSCLAPESLLEIKESVDVCQSVLDYLEDAREEGSPLGPYAEEMVPLYELQDRFARTFGLRGEILDEASTALASIRAELRRVRERTLRALQGVLRDHDLEPVVQEDFITVRGDRYVVPLKTDFRGYLSGIIHDRSRTGATFFVEPLETVELNNRALELREEEEDEVRRVLMELTAVVGRSSESIRGNVAVVAHVDCLAARLRLSRRLRCVRAELTPEPLLELRGARHPLLEAQKGDGLVPVDVLLSSSTRLLLVTGPNAGGKTVALKTAGLLVAMARSGLFVPAEEGSRIGWFRDVFVDIGDEQDLERDLSTFSAHMARWREVLDKAGALSLVLLDELGTGTDPGEGAALAMAMLKTLIGRGASVIATTHLGGLKAFVYANASSENAAVAFDVATGRPLFRLVYGEAGASNAFDVAERLGLQPDVVGLARSLATPGSDATADLIEGLESARSEARAAAQRVQELEVRLGARMAEQERLVEEALRERNAARLEARSEARRAVEDARVVLGRLTREYATRRLGQQEVRTEIRRVEERLEEALRPEAESGSEAGPPAELVAGARVWVRSLGKTGILEEADASAGKATVRLGSLKVTVRPEDLRAPEEEPTIDAAQRPAYTRFETVGAAAELVVVGLSVEEAIRRVDSALDRALVAGLSGFRVIHGRGTGALRRAIREHLGHTAAVTAVSPVEGDEAVTWVDLS